MPEGRSRSNNDDESDNSDNSDDSDNRDDSDNSNYSNTWRASPRTRRRRTPTTGQLGSKEGPPDAPVAVQYPGLIAHVCEGGVSWNSYAGVP